MDQQNHMDKNASESGRKTGRQKGGSGPQQPGRRKILPVLGGGLLLPLLPMRASTPVEQAAEEEYKTLLKPDGTAVRVKVSKLKKSKVIRKNISNTELLGWLKSKKDR